MESRLVWANRYAVFDEIASGGMATIYLAGRLGQVNGRRVVAVKKLYEQYAKQPEFVAMFLDEARLAARVRHPNVITTYQILRVPESLAIVMEFVVGVSLFELLRVAREREARTPATVAAAVIAGVLRGLHAAHETRDETGQPFGLVHRDISPHNVMVGKDGVPRVIDFGIAKAAGRLQNTEAGTLKGKFAYMAPEQIRGEEVDRRTDIYAVGIVLWEMMAGQRLFLGGSDMVVLASRASGEMRPSAASSINEAVTARADAVILRALEVDPADRFATAQDMARAVEDAFGTASTPEVANWVDRLAHVSIRDVEAKYMAVERAIASGELEDLTQIVAARPVPSERQSRPSLLFDATEIDLPVPGVRPPTIQPPPARPSSTSLRAQSGPSRSQMPPPRTHAPSTFPQSHTQSPTGYAEAAPIRAIVAPAPTRPPPPVDLKPPRPHVGTELQLDLTPGVRVQSRFATAAPPPVEVASAPVLSPLRRHLGNLWSVAGNIHLFESSGSRTIVACAAVLVLLVGAVAFEGSSLLESLAVRGAEQRGLLLTAARVTLGGGGLTLHDATFTLARSASITLKAPEVRVALDGWGSAENVTIPGYELHVEGLASEIAPRVHAWAGASHAPIQLDATHGHLVWKDAVVPGVSLDGRDATLAMNVADGPELHFTVPALTTTVAGAQLGPWGLHVDYAPEETKLVVALDGAHPDGPSSITVLVRPALGQLFSVAIPRSKLREIGIPSSMLGAGSDAELELALEGQLFPTGEPVKVHAKVGLFGATVPAFADAAAVTDIILEGEIGGRPADPLEVQRGTLRVQDVASAFRGRVMLDKAGARLLVDRAVAKSGAPEAFVFDTRAFTQPIRSDAP